MTANINFVLIVFKSGFRPQINALFVDFRQPLTGIKENNTLLKRDKIIKMMYKIMIQKTKKITTVKQVREVWTIPVIIVTRHVLEMWY